MTVRFVHCEFCQRIGNYTAMHMCPVCRKVICPRCKHEGPLKPGQCARAEPCPGQPPQKI